MFRSVPFFATVLLLIQGECAAAMDVVTIEKNLIPRVSFIFVRHGQTAWGPEAITLGPQDLELNPVGKEQAIHTAEYLAEHLHKPSIIISSPLVRAFQTAQEVEKSTHADQFVTIQDLVE